jgi:hypothetical protein
MEPPDSARLWICRDNWTKTQKDCFEAAGQFGVPIHGELYALLLEATIPVTEQPYTHAYPRQILRMNRLYSMPRHIIERAIHARGRSEN